MEASLLVGQVYRVLKNIQVYASARRVWLSRVVTFTFYKGNYLMRPPGGDPEKRLLPFVIFHFSRDASITASVMMRNFTCVLIMTCQPLVEFCKPKKLLFISDLLL